MTIKPPHTPYYLDYLDFLETVSVPASDGTESLPGLWGAPVKPTTETTATPCELLIDSDFVTLFGGTEKTGLRWTLSQVARFAIEHSDKLVAGCYGNFFELDIESRPIATVPCIVWVHLFYDGLSGEILRLSQSTVWKVDNRYRFFLLQQPYGKSW